MTTLSDLFVCANRKIDPDAAVDTIVGLVERGYITLVNPENTEDPEVLLTDRGLLATILERHV